jgi:ribose transport system substrate-binding protein
MLQRKLGRLVAVFAALLVASCSLVACSSASGGGSSNAAGGTTSSGAVSNPSDQAWFKHFQSVVAKGYQGDGTALPPAGPAAVKGKSVWYISPGESCLGCAQVGAGFKAAAKELGWKLTYLDSKLDPANTSAGIQQAIAAKADAIVPTFFDCSAIKNALEKAKAAGIPTVTVFAADCNPSLFSATVPLDGKPGNQGLENYTYVKTAWAITKTGGNAKAILIKEDDLNSVSEETAGFNRAMSQCPSCQTVATINLTESNYANIQALVAAALAKHPEANVLQVPEGGFLPGGIKAAVEQAGRQKRLYIIGAACDGGEIDLMKAGWTIVCGGYSQNQNGYMAADYVNRLLAGETPGDLPQVGIGYQLVDADHNLPKQGDQWVDPTDYLTAYRDAWNK